MTALSDLNLRRSNVKWFDGLTSDCDGAPVKMYDVVKIVETVTQHFDEHEAPMVIESGRCLLVVGAADDDTSHVWLDIDDLGPWTNSQICLPIAKIRYVSELGASPQTV